MSTINFKKKVYIVGVMGMLFLSTSCGDGAQQATQEVQPVLPTVLVTHFITQIVATNPPANSTPAPISTTPAPTAISGWDPFAVEIYYPLIGCVASRLHPGDMAFVAYGGGEVGIYSSLDIGYAPVLRYSRPGEVLWIFDGPWCQQGMIIWMVWSEPTDEPVIGFMAEGNGEEYWLLPMPPLTPTP